MVAETEWPVAIVGAGPAGATAALHLARRGIPTVVFEKQPFPRPKVCGDALMPDAVRALGRAGVYDEVAASGFVASRLVLYSPSRIDVAIESRLVVIRRVDLDAIVARAAARAGATIVHAAVRSLIPERDRVRLLLGDGSEVTARIVLVATGADVRLLRDLGRAVHPRPSAVAVRRYVTSSRRVDDLVVSFDRSIVPGYAWIFPLPNGAYNVGCGIVYDGGPRVDLARKLDAFLRDFPLARELMSGATEVTPVEGATLRTGLAEAVEVNAENVLAIGETIGTTFPLSGEGIGKAMETGERAAEVVARALAAGDLSLLRDFRTSVDALRPLYDAYATAERWLARPWLNDLITRLSRRSRYARRAFAEILDETSDPRAIFSLRGVARMLAG